MNACMWTIIDTLASFCIVANPNVVGEYWYSLRGSRIATVNIVDSTPSRYFKIDSSNVDGMVTNIAFDPFDPKVVYAGGVLMQGLYKSSDAGLTWQLVRRKKHMLTNYSGESIIVSNTKPTKVIAGNISRGEVEISKDGGESWELCVTNPLVPICSIESLDDKSDTLLLGCRGGNVMLLETNPCEGSCEFVAVEGSFSEIPRIKKDLLDSGRMYFVCAGYDETLPYGGVYESCDNGKTWVQRWLPRVSLWALYQQRVRLSFFVGGFSFSDDVYGAGHFYEINPYTDKVNQYDIPNTVGGRQSIWAMAGYEKADGSEVNLLLATDRGVIMCTLNGCH